MEGGETTVLAKRGRMLEREGGREGRTTQHLTRPAAGVRGSRPARALGFAC